LYLTQTYISDAQAEILREFLMDVKQLPAYQIHQLRIDDCGLTDRQFATILDGVRQQGSFLCQLTYSAGQFGS